MFRSFHHRVLLLVVGLVVVAQLTTFMAVLTTLDNDVKNVMREELTSGSELLAQLIDKRSDLLLNSAQALAADYGFKSAIASRDEQTIRSALSNNVSLIDADLASLIALDGTLISSTYSLNDDAARYADMIATAQTSDLYIGTTVLADKARNVVVVPIEAPQAIAWLLLGFALDDGLAAELKSQIDMEVSFAGNTKGRTHYFGSTLQAVQRDSLPLAMRRIKDSSVGHTALLDDEPFLTRSISLSTNSGGVSAVLQKSLDSATQSYRRLRNRLILLAGISLASALALAFWIARGVTRPVEQLSTAASRIREGDYNERLNLSRSDEFGQLANTFNLMQEGIAEREAQIVHQAYHDELTQLPNQRLARDRLNQQIESAKRRHESVAILLLGVNRFKQVNETLGHPIGDRLLQEVATRLQARMRDSDTVARIAGDEFLIVAGNADPVAVRALVSDLLQQVAEPVRLDKAELFPELSVGVAIYPQHGSDGTELVRRAGIALTYAKDNQSNLAFYEYGGDEGHLRRLSLVADLKRAVEENQLVMHYQPKINMLDGTVGSVEALVRWVHPEHGFMPPEEFIGLAESSGNICMLSNWVLRNVIAQASVWHKQGIYVDVAVNLSAMDSQDDALPGRINSYLVEHNLAPEQLILEVTESAMMRDTEKAWIVLQTLRDRGVTISIDDFGTGYSSLAKLRDLPVDELKIDRSFLKNIKPNAADALIVKAIIDLGHSMNMKITAEGVETETEWELLKQLGSDMVQGYFISKPMPAREFASWWITHNARSDMSDAA